MLVDTIRTIICLVVFAMKGVWKTLQSGYKRVTSCCKKSFKEEAQGRHLPVMHCKKGSEGWQIYGQTRRALEEVGAIGLDKRSFGLDFSDPAVCAVFPAQVDAAELVGLVSNICVLSNAVALQSRWPDAQLTVDASLTDSFDRKLHEAALDVLEGIHVNVIHRGNGR
jgi:nicotinamidase-related amidase